MKKIDAAVVDLQDRVAAIEKHISGQSEQDDIYQELEELRAFKARTLREKALENNSIDVSYFKI